METGLKELPLAIKYGVMQVVFGNRFIAWVYTWYMWSIMTGGLSRQVSLYCQIIMASLTMFCLPFGSGIPVSHAATSGLILSASVE